MRIVIGRFVIETSQKFNSNEEIVNFVLDQFPSIDKELAKKEIENLKLFNDTDGTIKESNEIKNSSPEVNSGSIEKERVRKNK